MSIVIIEGERNYACIVNKYRGFHGYKETISDVYFYIFIEYYCDKL